MSVFFPRTASNNILLLTKEQKSDLHGFNEAIKGYMNKDREMAEAIWADAMEYLSIAYRKQKGEIVFRRMSILENLKIKGSIIFAEYTEYHEDREYMEKTGHFRLIGTFIAEGKIGVFK